MCKELLRYLCLAEALAEAFKNKKCLPMIAALPLDYERRSRHNITARPAATIKATPLAQSGIAIPLIVMSQPNKSRNICSKATSEKTTTATRVKGLFIFRSFRECRCVTGSDGLRGV